MSPIPRTTPISDAITSDAAPPLALTRRQRVGGVLAIVLALALLTTGIAVLGLSVTFASVLYVAGAAAVGLAAVKFLQQARGRGLLVLSAWLAALGISVVWGEFQNRQNATAALGAQNTEYFLPIAVWSYLAAAYGVAVLVTRLTRRR